MERLLKFVGATLLLTLLGVIIGLAVALVGSLLLPPPAARMSPDRFVVITSPTGTGSGVILDSRYILTAGHVADGTGGRVSVIYRDAAGKAHVVFAQVRAVENAFADPLDDIHTDLAVLELELPLDGYARLDQYCGPLEDFQTIHSYGHNVGSMWRTAITGTVASSQPYRFDTVAVQLFWWPGNSGGPVFLPDGRLLSVVSGMFVKSEFQSRHNSGFGFFTTPATVCDFVADHAPEID